MSLNIRPISFNAAKKWVGEHHRHSAMPQGWKFGAAIYDDDEMVGVVMCKRPTSRHIEDGFTLEISRLCTDGTRNACSFAYAAMIRAAKALGYCKVITYTLDEESGSSLRACGFRAAHRAYTGSWAKSLGERATSQTNELRVRWEIQWAKPPIEPVQSELTLQHTV